MKTLLLALLVICTYGILQAGDVSERYIASRQEIFVTFDEGASTMLKVREVIELSPNRYLGPNDAGGKSTSVAVKTSTLEILGAASIGVRLLGEPKISLSAGKCTGITVSDSNRLRLLIDIGFGENPPESLQIVAEYGISVKSKPERLGFSVTPYIHNFDFIPPVLFKMGKHRITVVSSGERPITMMVEAKEKSQRGTMDVTFDSPEPAFFAIK